MTTSASADDDRFAATPPEILLECERVRLIHAAAERDDRELHKRRLQSLLDVRCTCTSDARARADVYVLASSFAAAASTFSASFFL